MVRHTRVKAAALITAVLAGGQVLSSSKEDYPFHGDPNRLLVTRGSQIIKTLPCERISVDGEGRWANSHVRGQIGRTSNGTLYAQLGGAYGAYWVVGECRNVMLASTDEGRVWQRWNVDLEVERIIGAFTVLNDDAFLAAATAPGDVCISFHRSTDRGKNWERISEVRPGPFSNIYLDGNLLQLKDGTLLCVLIFAVPAPEGKHFSQGIALEYVFRSTDEGRTWQGGPDPKVWKPLIDSKLIIASIGPESRVPGAGGTFPGCYETGLAELSDGRIAAVLRFSGAQYPWHHDYIEAWGGKAADDVGRIFRQVMLSFSYDGGLSWGPMRPFTDRNGRPVIVQQETNGQMVETPDGYLVLIHQRRFGPSQLIARISTDRGKTWLHDEYRLSAGFGYSGNLVLNDGTIITVTGKSIGERHSAQFIRWRPEAE